MPSPTGVNFSVFSRHATGVQLLLFDGVDDTEATRVVRLDPSANRTYHYWHVNRVAIAKKIGRGGVVGEGVHDLLSGPRRSGMGGDVEVQDPAPMVSEEDQDEEHPQLSGGNGKDVDRDQVPDMVREERAPGLGGGSGASGSGERPYAPPLQCRA
jgi:hypothetical protein